MSPACSLSGKVRHHRTVWNGGSGSGSGDVATTAADLRLASCGPQRCCTTFRAGRSPTSRPEKLGRRATALEVQSRPTRGSRNHQKRQGDVIKAANKGMREGGLPPQHAVQRAQLRLGKLPQLASLPSCKRQLAHAPFHVHCRHARLLTHPNVLLEVRAARWRPVDLWVVGQQQQRPARTTPTRGTATAMLLRGSDRQHDREHV